MLIQGIMLLKVLGLSFGQDSNYMGGHDFVHSNQASAVIGPYIRPQNLPSTPFPVHLSFLLNHSALMSHLN
jgi:hypothetical protein